MADKKVRQADASGHAAIRQADASGHAATRQACSRVATSFYNVVARTLLYNVNSKTTL